MPPGGRLARGDSLVAPVVSPARLVWRIERAEDGAVVASGVAEPDTAPGTIRAGGLAPGAYRLVAGNRAAPFVVESWAPDLAWTASDTASLAAAARASGGALVARPAELAAALERLPRAGGAPSAEGLAARAFGLGTTPWAYLAVALLLLAEWALGRRALASPPPQG